LPKQAPAPGVVVWWQGVVKGHGAPVDPAAMPDRHAAAQTVVRGALCAGVHPLLPFLLGAQTPSCVSPHAPLYLRVGGAVFARGCNALRAHVGL
jgi:hypothetical protein